MLLSIKMSKKLLHTFFALFFTASLAWAQEPAEEVPVEEVPEKEEKHWRDKVFFGGGGGLQFSNVGTYVALQPSVGYRLTPRWSAGIMGNYQFFRYRTFDRSVHNYGGSLFTRYMVYAPIFATAEYEQMNMNILRLNQETSRQWVERMLVGAGYFQPGGRRGGFFIAILYDFSFRNSPDYPYESPIVYRVGFTF